MYQNIKWNKWLENYQRCDKPYQLQMLINEVKRALLNNYKIEHCDQILEKIIKDAAKIIDQFPSKRIALFLHDVSIIDKQFKNIIQVQTLKDFSDKFSEIDFITFNYKDVSMSVCAVARVKIFQEETIVRNLIKQADSKYDTNSRFDNVQLLWGIAKIGVNTLNLDVKGQKFVNKLTRGIIQDSKKLTVPQLVQVIWSCAKLQIEEKSVINNLKNQVQTNIDNFNEQQLETIVYSFDTLNYNDRKFAIRLSNKLKSVNKLYNNRDTIKALNEARHRAHLDMEDIMKKDKLQPLLNQAIGTKALVPIRNVNEYNRVKHNSMLDKSNQKILGPIENPSNILELAHNINNDDSQNSLTSLSLCLINCDLEIIEQCSSSMAITYENADYNGKLNSMLEITYPPQIPYSNQKHISYNGGTAVIGNKFTITVAYFNKFLQYWENYLKRFEDKYLREEIFHLNKLEKLWEFIRQNDIEPTEGMLKAQTSRKLYAEISKQTHPDRPTGNTQLHQSLEQIYKSQDVTEQEWLSSKSLDKGYLWLQGCNFAIDCYKITKAGTPYIVPAVKRFTNIMAVYTKNSKAMWGTKFISFGYEAFWENNYQGAGFGVITTLGINIAFQLASPYHRVSSLMKLGFIAWSLYEVYCNLEDLSSITDKKDNKDSDGIKYIKREDKPNLSVENAIEIANTSREAEYKSVQNEQEQSDHNATNQDVAQDSFLDTDEENEDLDSNGECPCENIDNAWGQDQDTDICLELHYTSERYKIIQHNQYSNHYRTPIYIKALPIKIDLNQISIDASNLKKLSRQYAQFDLLTVKETTSVALVKNVGNWKAGSKWTLKSLQFTWVVNEYTVSQINRLIFNSETFETVLIRNVATKTIQIAVKMPDDLRTFFPCDEKSTIYPNEMADFVRSWILSGLLQDEDHSNLMNYGKICRNKDSCSIMQYNFHDSLAFFYHFGISKGMTEDSLSQRIRESALKHGKTTTEVLAMMDTASSGCKFGWHCLIQKLGEFVIEKFIVSEVSIINNAPLFIGVFEELLSVDHIKRISIVEQSFNDVAMLVKSDFFFQYQYDFKNHYNFIALQEYLHEFIEKEILKGYFNTYEKILTAQYKISPFHLGPEEILQTMHYKSDEEILADFTNLMIGRNFIWLHNMLICLKFEYYTKTHDTESLEKFFVEYDRAEIKSIKCVPYYTVDYHYNGTVSLEEPVSLGELMSSYDATTIESF